MDFFSIQGTIVQFGGYMVGAITAGFMIIQSFGKGFQETDAKRDKAAADLIGILQGTVNALNEKVDVLQRAHLENVKELSRLRGENETFAKLLQGRDEMSQKFQQEGFAAFVRTEETQKHIERVLTLLEENN